MVVLRGAHASVAREPSGPCSWAAGAAGAACSLRGARGRFVDVGKPLAQIAEMDQTQRLKARRLQEAERAGRTIFDSDEDEEGEGGSVNQAARGPSGGESGAGSRVPSMQAA